MSTVVVSCGALALHVKKIAARRGWDVEVRPVPPELHNRPERIRAAVAEAAGGEEVVVAYAHCGADLAGYATLPGAHCYEVYGAEHEPATYFLTDFLVNPLHASPKLLIGYLPFAALGLFGTLLRLTTWLQSFHMPVWQPQRR